MQTESVASTGTDPLKAVADALDTAVKATKDGVEKARETATGALPAAGEFLTQAAYKTCYGISFGVVFPTMLLVPRFRRKMPPFTGSSMVPRPLSTWSRR